MLSVMIWQELSQATVKYLPNNRSYVNVFIIILFWMFSKKKKKN